METPRPAPPARPSARAPRALRLVTPPRPAAAAAADDITLPSANDASQSSSPPSVLSLPPALSEADVSPALPLELTARQAELLLRAHGLTRLTVRLGALVMVSAEDRQGRVWHAEGASLDGALVRLIGEAMERARHPLVTLDLVTLDVPEPGSAS